MLLHLWYGRPLVVLTVLASISAAIAPCSAQRPPAPRNMFCGGNELIQEGSLRASSVSGIVTDDTAPIPLARVQIQVQGRDDILRERETDKKGRFSLGPLRPGKYWLGISRAGFNLHFWDLTITRFGGAKRLLAHLSLGT